MEQEERYIIVKELNLSVGLSRVYREFDTVTMGHNNAVIAAQRLCDRLNKEQARHSGCKRYTIKF